MLWFIELQGVGHDWATEVNWILFCFQSAINRFNDLSPLLDCFHLHCWDCACFPILKYTHFPSAQHVLWHKTDIIKHYLNEQKNNSLWEVEASIQFKSITQSCPTLCDPMDCSMPGIPVHQQLTEFTQMHVNRAGDGIQPSHPLSSRSPPTFNLSLHQGLFKWVSPLHQLAKGFQFQLQHQSFQWILRNDFL